METVVLSDLHGFLPNDLPNHELLLICGDISPLDIQRDIESMNDWFLNIFLPWVESQDCKRCFMVWGNHDFIGEHPEFEMYVNSTDGKLRILTDRYEEYEGLKIYGTPWCPELRRWAFYGDHETLEAKFKLIPNNMDILLSHCAPRIGHFGVVGQSRQFNSGDDYGCVELTDAIDRAFPRYCFFGHIHSGQHKEELYKGLTILANCSVKDENYYPFYPYQVFDI